MSGLRIDLQEGFRNDTVIVRVNGEEVFQKSGVTTRLSASIADSFEVPVEGSPSEVEVEASTRALTGKGKVDAEHTPYLGVSIEGAAIRFERSVEPFRYL